MKVQSIVSWTCAAVAIAAWMGYVFSPGPVRRDGRDRQVLAGGRSVRADAHPGRQETRIPVSVPSQPASKTLALSDGEKKPVALQGDDELLKEVIDGLMQALSSAMKSGDADRILDLAAKLKAINYGAKDKGGLSAASVAYVKRMVLDAVAPYGPDGAATALELVNDPDPLVDQTARDTVLYSARDLHNGDFDCAEIVVKAAAEFSDSKSLDILFRQLGRMRNSVGADVLAQIAASGTAEARERLPAEISHFTGDTSVTTVEGLSAWLAKHPDNRDADRLNGPRNITVAR